MIGAIKYAESYNVICSDYCIRAYSLREPANQSLVEILRNNVMVDEFFYPPQAVWGIFSDPGRAIKESENRILERAVDVWIESHLLAGNLSLIDDICEHYQLGGMDAGEISKLRTLIKGRLANLSHAIESPVFTGLIAEVTP